MEFYLPSSWVSPSTLSYGLNGGPSMHWAPSSTMDLFDMQQALYEAELIERRRAIQREQVRRWALEREREAQAVAAARRMALALAAEEEARKRQLQERHRMCAEHARQNKRQRKLVHLVQMGPFVVEFAEPDSVSEPQSACGQDCVCAPNAKTCGCDTLSALGSDSTHKPSVNARATAPVCLAQSSTESTTEPATEPTEESTKSTTEPTTELTTEPTAEPTEKPTEKPTAEPIAEPTAEPTTEPSTAVETSVAESTLKPKEESAILTTAPATEPSSGTANSSESTNSQLLFSYDFPPCDTTYGRDVRKQVQADRIAVEANTLNGGSIQIRGLWAKSASPGSRASSSRSAHVRDVDENGDEVLLPEDTDSESEADAHITFDESAVLPLPALDKARALRAELNDQGFQLWLDL
ncbi:Uncharacterized protein MSYG_2063 [Malassezia sympodialis ATCC 42132]|uniref:Uncharacterized protein n=1 Tax=Malassezia sympodialis (strain ATCC 42132) TaxID=1230383 RepID=A0A1M8A5L6_MALS4|nr:Uncharacterized protein MSYG_2063 [Malassezia sympodialis ATCC 42132]